MIISFAKVEGTRVLGFFEADDEGPLDVDFPHQWVALQVDGWPAAPGPGMELHIDAAGELYWMSTETLPDLKLAAIAQTYKDVDAIYDDAIGRRATEYKDADEAARAFAAAGFAGQASVYVSSYAQYNPTGSVQTNRWAAEQIIARADAFLLAQSAMRSTRFACQAQMQAAANRDDLSAAVATWNGFITVLRGQLGL